MSALDAAAKNLYEHQLARANLNNAPSWSSLSEHDREDLRTEARIVLRTFHLAKISKGMQDVAP